MSTEPQANQRLGRHITSTVGGEAVRAFVPPPLPPYPALQLASLQLLMEQANQALGRLDGLSSLLPDLSLFLYAYVRKEAVFSSQIEGTQSSLSDLLLYESQEAPGVPLEDVVEVSNYVAALHHGLQRLRSGFPLSLRLIREIHGVLLQQGRGNDKSPGEFRRSQNWIGGTRPGNAYFVPPPPAEMLECMGQLELFLHEERPDLPPLLQAGLAHVQFETIHPVLDGNGRLGRLLITFLLCSAGVLQEPILYLSLYFKKNRPTYYELLNRVRSHGEWELWLEFFLSGVKETSEQGVATARRILALLDADRRRMEEGGVSPSALRLHQFAQTKPIFSIAQAAASLELSFPTVSAAVKAMQPLGILQEITKRERDRLFAYSTYLAILNEGSEPLPAVTR
jgi:Fic family protein